jgi:short-subunit dehydrogenase
MKETIAIIGTGNGISKATASHFGRQGYKVVLVSRTAEKLKLLANELKEQEVDASYLIADVSDSAQFTAAISSIKNLAVLHYNAYSANATSILLEDEQALVYDFKVNVVGLFTAVKAAFNSLEENKGSILITGGGLSKYPHPNYASLSIGKAAQASLANSLSQTLSQKNIFVGLLQINGFVNEQDAVYNPKNIASTLWDIYSQKNTFENVI